VGRLEALVLASRSDPGVVIYDLHRSTADTLWFLYERHESQEHFDRHRENPVLRRFIADAATLLDGKLDVRTFRVIAGASSTLVSGSLTLSSYAAFVQFTEEGTL